MTNFYKYDEIETYFEDFLVAIGPQSPECYNMIFTTIWF